VDSQYVDADGTFLGRCVAGADDAADVLVRDLYEPHKSTQNRQVKRQKGSKNMHNDVQSRLIRTVS